jgi:hypothetical protein
VDGFGHLDGELARGREHERLHLGALQVDRLKDRKGEGGRLAGAGLRLADDVAAGEERGDGARLDGRGGFVADLCQGGEEFGSEAEVGEGGHWSHRIRAASPWTPSSNFRKTRYPASSLTSTTSLSMLDLLRDR